MTRLGLFFTTGDPRRGEGGGVLREKTRIDEESSTIYRMAIHLFPVPPQFSHRRGDFSPPVPLVTRS